MKLPGTDVDLPDQLRDALQPIESISPNPRNPRIPRRVDHLVDVIKRYGFTDAIVVNAETREIEAGHMRLAAATQLGATHVPVVLVDHSATDAVAYAIAHNKSSETVADWDDEELLALLDELKAEDITAESLGFTNEELETIVVQGADTDASDVQEDATREGAPEPADDIEAQIGPVSELAKLEPGTHQLGRHTLFVGDCIEFMREQPDASFDAICTDPPYGIGFMGKAWDCAVPGDDFAEQALRVLKPGGHIIAFAATRTVHRLTAALEGAGFEIRDQIAWLYFSGFPKGLPTVHNIAKHVWCQLPENAKRVVQTSQPVQVKSDAGGEGFAVAPAVILPGGERVLITQTGEEVGLLELTDTSRLERLAGMSWSIDKSWPTNSAGDSARTNTYITKTLSSTTIDQRTWRSLTSASISLSTTRAHVTLESGQRWPALTVGRASSGTDRSCETIPVFTAIGPATWNTLGAAVGTNVALKPSTEPAVLARKPLDGNVAHNFIENRTGILNIDACRFKPGDPAWVGPNEAEPLRWEHGRSMGYHGAEDRGPCPAGTSPGRWPANIYYCPKPSTAERDAGTETLPHVKRTDITGREEDSAGQNNPRAGNRSKREIGNHHTTVKPIGVMRWLLKLITPPGGRVLEPFAGSGTTLVAACDLDCEVVGCEISPEYAAIVKARVEARQR